MHLLGTHQYRSTLQPAMPAMRYRSLSTRISNRFLCPAVVLRTRCLAFLIE